MKHQDHETELDTPVTDIGPLLDFSTLVLSARSASGLGLRRILSIDFVEIRVSNLSLDTVPRIPGPRGQFEGGSMALEICLLVVNLSIARQDTVPPTEILREANQPHPVA